MEKETGRIEAFSDGIFSVAITLLALEIGIKDIPEANITNSRFWEELMALWPKYLAFLSSFASVLLMWMSHHKIFKILRSTNTSIVLTNGLLLLTVALVPFPVKTVGEYFPTEARQAAVIFYTGYSVILSLVFWLLCYTILKNKKCMMPDAQSLAALQKMNNGLMIGTVITIVIFLIALFSPYIAISLNFSTWIFWAGVSHAAEQDGDHATE